MAVWCGWVSRALRGLLLVGALGGALVGVAGCGSALAARSFASPCACYGDDQGGDFQVPAAALGGRPLHALRVVWRLAADAAVYGQPVAAGGRVYFGSNAGTVYAAELANGRVLWKRHLGAAPSAAYGEVGITGAVLLDRGRLLVPDGTGWVYALDPRTGATLWKTDIGQPHSHMIRSSPRALEGLLFFGVSHPGDTTLSRGREVALDAATGRVRWVTPFVDYRGGGSDVFPTAAEAPSLGLVYTATGNPCPEPQNPGCPGPIPAGPDHYSESIIALHARTGSMAWFRQTHAHDPFDLDFIASPNVFATPHGLAVGDGQKDGNYYAFDARTGAALWVAHLTAARDYTLIIGTAAAGGGRLFVPTMDMPLHPGAKAGGRLVALSAAGGRVLWSYHFPAIVEPSALLVGPYVFAMDNAGELVALRAATGEPVASIHLGQVWKGGFTAARGLLLIPQGSPPGVVAVAAGPAPAAVPPRPASAAAAPPTASPRSKAAAGSLPLHGRVSATSPAHPSYRGDIAPLLQAECSVCHGPGAPLAGLDLTTYRGLMKGGAAGPVVVPGHPGRSALVLLLQGKDPRLPGVRMPAGHPLTPAQIHLVARWIRQGARDN